MKSDIIMKYFKTILFPLIILGLFNEISAQSALKYKDVFETLSTQGEELAYPLLRQHQQQDPLHANTYYQLGVISQKWAKKYDPLTE